MCQKGIDNLFGCKDVFCNILAAKLIFSKFFLNEFQRIAKSGAIKRDFTFHTNYSFTTNDDWLFYVDALLDSFNPTGFECRLNLNSSDTKKNQPYKNKVNDSGGNKREKRLIGTSTYNITHSGKVVYGDIADN